MEEPVGILSVQPTDRPMAHTKLRAPSLALESQQVIHPDRSWVAYSELNPIEAVERPEDYELLHQG